MAGTKLRAKTGCFTCRRRKVKCGEEKPSCHNCFAFGRQCVWPTSLDLCDRRHRSHARPDSTSASSSPFRFNALSEEPKPQQPLSDAGCKGIVAYRGTSPAPGRSLFQSGIELELVHHLLNHYFSVLVLPTSSVEHFIESQSELIDMMFQCQSVKHAVLACCASNKHILLNDNRYQNVSLRFYSQAVHELNQRLVEFQQGGKQPDSLLLTTVIFLYIHDLWGLDASADPRNHVTGAVNLLNLLCQDGASPVSMTQGFDRIIAESVLYQAFLLSTRRPFAPYFHVDAQFVTRAERLLVPQDTHDPSYAACSPVLGVPTALYRLKLGIINFHNSPAQQSPRRLAQLRSEMDYWEALVVPRDAPRLISASAAHAFDLVILATSLLLDLITESFTQQLPIDLLSFSNGAQLSRWQVDMSLEILRQPQDVDKWTRMFLGAWPLLILGYAVRSDEDMELVQRVLGQMRQRIGYGEVQRIQEELQRVWNSRRNKVYR